METDSASLRIRIKIYIRTSRSRNIYGQSSSEPYVESIDSNSLGEIMDLDEDSHPSNV
jgi:hypothetical protein